MSRSNPLNSFIRTRCGASGPRGDGAGPTAPGARRCQKTRGKSGMGEPLCPLP